MITASQTHAGSCRSACIGSTLLWQFCLIRNVRRWRIPERGSVVKWFSRWFLASLFRQGTYGHRRSPELRLVRLRQGPFGGPVMARPRTSGVDRSWSFQRVRSQSFFSWRLHLNTSLRASTGPTASAQTVRFGPSGTVLFFATILRGQARPNHTDVRLGLLPTDPCATSN